jgi:hypothetical protein
MQHSTKASFPQEYAEQNTEDRVEIDLKYEIEDVFIDKTDPANNDDTDIEEDEEDAEFALWLQSISQCLSGKYPRNQ